MAEETEGSIPSLEGTDEAAAAIRRLAEAFRANKEELEAQKKILEEISKLNLDTGTLIENNLALRAQEVAIADEELKELSKKLQLKAEITEQDREQLETAVKNLKNLQDQEKATKSINVATDRLVKTTLGVSGAWKDTALGGIIKSKDGVKEFGQALKVALSPEDIAGSTLMKIQESTIALIMLQDKLGSQFMKTTGLGRDYVAVINEAYLVNRQFAVSLEESTQAATSLTTQMAQFTMMTRKERGSLLQFTSLLDAAGVDSSNAAESFNFLSKGLAMTGPEIKKVSLELVGLSKSLSIPPDIIFKDFAAATSELAKYGRNMVGVFKDLEVQAKNTGLSVQELIGLAKQFDTFESAGEAVGRLNALLGGPYLNSIDMLNMSEADRIKTLRQSIALTGKSFDSLNRFEKQAIASAAGITDMSVAAQLFGGTNADFAAYQATQKDLEEQAKRNADMMKKMQEVMMAFGMSMLPVVKSLTGFIDGVNKILNISPNFSKFLFATIIGITLLTKAVNFTRAATGAYAFVLDLVAKRKAAVSAATAANTQLNLLNTVSVRGATTANTGLAISLRGVGAAMKMVFLPLAAGIVTFLAFKKIMAGMSPVVKTLVALAAAAAAFAIAATVGSGAIAITAGMVGVGAALGTLTAPPKFNKGVDGTTEGLFIAGEGPTGKGKNREMVATGGRRTNVITNENTEALLGAGGRGGAIAALTTEIRALKQTIGASKAMGPAKTGQPRQIVLQVDQGILGEFIDDHLDNNSDMSLTR
tara:strand:+ start:12125 stop:14410 length:2286 start_codon:yes stop_codon:yes gene_type:complete